MCVCVCVCVCVCADLHGYREVGLGLRRKEDINRLLLEGLVARGRGAHLDDVELERGGGSEGGRE